MTGTQFGRAIQNVGLIDVFQTTCSIITLQVIENRTDTTSLKICINPFIHIIDHIKKEADLSLFFFHLIQVNL